MRLRFSLITIALISLASTWASGQAARSPFASYGLGEYYTPALNQNLGMGGVGVSNFSFWHVNNQNPAALVFNRITSFQFGVVGEQRTQSSTTSTDSEKSGSGNLNHITLAVPIKFSKWSVAVGLQPYTRLNYKLTFDQPVGTSGTSVSVTEQGSGGVNSAYISNGVAITDDISVGLKAAYLFSSTVNTFSNILASSTATILPTVEETTYVRGFQFSPAVHIHLDSLFGKNYLFNVGVVYDLGTNLDSRFTLMQKRFNIAGRMVDSTTLINSAAGKITLPQSVAAGISFGNNYRWIVAVDGFYSNFSQYRSLDGTNPYQANMWRLAGGFELTPDPQSLTSYLKRATYRTGVSIENSPYLVNGAMVRDFGITFGLSLPVSRSSSLDLGMKLGKKGDKATNTVEENYLKLYFGITFNDQWFIKRRFD